MDMRAATGRIASELLRCRDELRGLKKQQKFLLSSAGDDSDSNDYDVETSNGSDSDDYDVENGNIGAYDDVGSIEFGSYDELIMSSYILKRICVILKDFKYICDALGTELFDFELVYSLGMYYNREQHVKCRVRRLEPYEGSFIAKVGDLLSGEAPVAVIEVDGWDFCVLGGVSWEPEYTVESVLTVRDLPGGGPAVEEIKPM